MNLKKIISILLVLIWMIVIFSFSNMDSTKSNNQSKGAIDKVVEVTIDTSNQLGIVDEVPTEEQKQNIVNKLNKPLRKIMHFTIYLILAILILNALNNFNIKNKTIITIIFCLIYAITDEYHQTLINGRTGQLSDVLIDTIGSIIDTLIYNKLKINKKMNQN